MREAKEYPPELLVVVWRVCPVGPTTVTFAFGKSAPVEAVTVPTMPPVETEVCASTTEDKTANETTISVRVRNNTARRELKLYIECLPFLIVLANRSRADSTSL